MRIHRFESEQFIERPLSDLFAFFADARNLQLITPPWLSFEILTPDPIKMEPGSLIDYRLRVHGISLRWRSEITVWNPPHHFVDVQRRGPYRLWKHEHSFVEHDSGTMVHDRVDYAVPGGRLVQRLFVRRDLERIFAFRAEALADIFQGGSKL